jgi:ABC-type branched-subunit amino acid transport system ATPase component/ABC-type branched-subunit amino acid transport system permease subunit
VETYLVFALIGLGAGAVYAGLGAGLVAAFKGTGIINFAQGAVAMWGTYVYSELRTTGDFVFPLVGVPHRVSVAAHVPFTAALILGVLSAALVSLVAHIVVFRPLRAAPALAKVVVSVGLMLTLEAVATLEFGSQQRVVASFLPSRRVEIAGLAVPEDRFYLAGFAIAAAALLWAWFRFTRVGLATRAAAENERAASLAGYSPDRLAGTSWLLSGALAGLFGILVAPLTGLNTVNFTLFIVPALAVALVGRLSSFAATCVAGLALGMAQSELLYLQTQSWYPRWAAAGATDALPFLVIIAALFAVGKSLPTRGAVERERMPEVLRPTRVLGPALCLTAAAAALLVVLGGSYRFGLIESLILATLMLSFVVLTGLVGQISLAQAAFAGVAGFALSKLGTHTGVPFPLSMLLAAGCATALGLVVGLPALRIRGAQLGVVTLGAAVAIEKFVFDNPSFTPLSGNVISDPKLAGVDLGIRSGHSFVRLAFGVFALGVLLLVALGVANIARGSTGRRLLAVRSNERAAAAAGVSVASTKLLAFAVSSFVAGIGGAMLGYSRGQLSAASFDTFSGLEFLVFAYLGGITSVTGALVAGLLAPLGLVFVALNRVVDLGDYYLLASGVTVIAVAVLNPQGLDGATRQNVALLRRVWARRRSVAGSASVRAVPDDVLPPLPGHRRRPRSQPGKAPLLETRDLTVSYGSHRAVDRVSLRVDQGAIVGLIGPNGAGKTTLVDALTGFVDHGGCVRFDGGLLTGSPHVRSRRGLTRTWQSLELFDDLTAVESLLVAAQRPTVTSFLLDLVRPTRREEGQTHWALDLFGLAHIADRRPGELSLGQQKLLGVARALASSPKLVCLDEPAAGLSPVESRALGERFATMLDHEITVLLIDHDVDLVLGVCDYIYVLDFGRLVAEGTPAEIRRSETVIAAYLGHRTTQAEEAQPPASRPQGSAA